VRYRTDGKIAGFSLSARDLEERVMQNVLSVPDCPKCNRAMKWDSLQTVATRHGKEAMQIFKCETCARLAAVSASAPAAA
jgi:ribosomal protein L37AE/L43A